MRHIAYLVFSIALISLAACGDDPFATTVEIDLPDHDPLPVVTLDVRAGDTALYSRVGLSRGILEDPMPTSARPTFSFIRNGVTIASRELELSSTDGDDFGYRPVEINGEAEATYRVQVDFPGYETVFAEQTMPSTPIVENVNYERDGAIDVDGYRVDEINFDLQDDPATEDYYGFRVRFIYRDTFITNCGGNANEPFRCDTIINIYANQAYVSSPDPTLRQSFDFGLVVSDVAFSSGTFRVRMTSDNYGRGQPILEVYHLTEDAYRYGVSRLAYEDLNGNPFAEPVTVHNNVENGYGYFILSNKTEVVLRE